MKSNWPPITWLINEDKNPSFLPVLQQSIILSRFVSHTRSRNARSRDSPIRRLHRSSHGGAPIGRALQYTRELILDHTFLPLWENIDVTHVEKMLRTGYFAFCLFVWYAFYYNTGCLVVCTNLCWLQIGRSCYMPTLPMMPYFLLPKHGRAGSVTAKLKSTKPCCTPPVTHYLRLKNKQTMCDIVTKRTYICTISAEALLSHEAIR